MLYFAGTILPMAMMLHLAVRSKEVQAQETGD
jgi:hypothetical protein